MNYKFKRLTKQYKQLLKAFKYGDNGLSVTGNEIWQSRCVTKPVNTFLKPRADNPDH